ncbi:peptidase M20 [Alteribacter lacisalsi]|uniref:Peptidase M20 n=1 Tax=Alteribacter lacisalsi TaxID=2045244 RepID=A0A2W0HB27_9BACI|nr:amidohydrolase [Alteribacter lacisalsi]PYZ99064.1 peptidase M20 [Alteribacter lacisalsi]
MIHLDEYADRLEPLLKGWRRQFHREPETGWTEYRTTWRIYEELSRLSFTLYIGDDCLVNEARMGVPAEAELRKAEEKARAAGVPETLLKQISRGRTGVVATMDTGKPGPETAMRFDIDALPVNEASVPGHLPEDQGFRSAEEGRMHACAHDGHTAIGLAVAHFLHDHQHQLRGTFVLLFQPAEEGSRGAKAMVEKGWLDHADYFLGGHIGIEDLPVGTISAGSDQFLATSKFDLAFTGTAAHAGKRPEEGKNALLAAAACVQNLHSIAPHSGGATRLNVGTLKAGSGRNIIPEQAYLTGETRGETEELNRYVLEETKRISEAAAAMYGVTADFSVCGTGTVAACDQELKQLITKAASRTDQVTQVLDSVSLGASEDVTHMINRVQKKGGLASYMIFGTPLPAGHHHPSFDFDEAVLKIGFLAFASAVTEISLTEEE